MLAALCGAPGCLAQEPAAAVAEAGAPAPGPSPAVVTADVTVQTHSLRTFLRRLYSMRALTSTLPAAVVEQAHNWPDEWGKDRLGFEKRIASLYGQYVIGVALEETIKALHYEDTRYRRLGQGNFLRRTGHVITDTVTARRQDGSRTPAWSLYAYAYGSWSIATLWSPREYRTAASIAEWGSSGMGTFAVTNLAREYWPDIKRVFHHKKAI